MLHANFNKHYERAKDMWKGYVVRDPELYEIHVKSAHAYLNYANMLDSNDVRAKNVIKMYNELVNNYMFM